MLCAAQLCGGLSVATISFLHNGVHPSKLQIKPPKTACDCPCGGVIIYFIFKAESHTQYSHRMECICQCTTTAERQTGREGDRNREWHRVRDRETERQSQPASQTAHRETDRDRQTDRQRNRDKQTETHRESIERDRQRQRQTDIQTDR